MAANWWKLKGLKVTLILEPGRVLVGNAGILVTKVLYTKEGDAKHFIIVDAGMNDLARPSLYGSYHGLAGGAGVCVRGPGDGLPGGAHLRVRGFPGQGPRSCRPSSRGSWWR